MSAKNHAPLLERAIYSILNQTYENYEFLIVDDFSSDNSFEILKNIAKKDKRIKIYRNNSPIGLTKSLNLLIKNSNTKNIVRQDADDISSYQRLEEINNIKNINLVTSFIYSGDKIYSFDTSPEIILYHFLFHNYFGAHGQLCFKKIYYNEYYKYCQDYELVSQFLRDNYKNIAVIQKPLYNYIKSSNSIFYKHRTKQNYYSIKISQKNIKYFLGIDLSFNIVKNLRLFFVENKLPEKKDDFLIILKYINKLYKNKYGVEVDVEYKKILDNI
jgi:glycosyltransferase involved in cell wall biosynthesis